MEILNSDLRTFSGENDAKALQLRIEPDLVLTNIRLAFESPAGCRYLTPIVNFTDCEALYYLPNTVLDAPGKLKVQMIASDSDGFCMKSKVYEFTVAAAIDPNENALPENQLTSFININDRMDNLESILAADAEYGQVLSVTQNGVGWCDPENTNLTVSAVYDAQQTEVVYISHDIEAIMDNADGFQTVFLNLLYETDDDISLYGLPLTFASADTMQFSAVITENCVPTLVTFTADLTEEAFGFTKQPLCIES